MFLDLKMLTCSAKLAAKSLAKPFPVLHDSRGKLFSSWWNSKESCRLINTLLLQNNMWTTGETIHCDTGALIQSQCKY